MVDPAVREAVRRNMRRQQVETVRDIFGNPFRPVVLDTGWLSSDVLALVRGIYDEKANCLAGCRAY